MVSDLGFVNFSTICQRIFWYEFSNNGNSVPSAVRSETCCFKNLYPLYSQKYLSSISQLWSELNLRTELERFQFIKDVAFQHIPRVFPVDLIDCYKFTDGHALDRHL